MSLYSLLRNFELLLLKPHLGERGKVADVIIFFLERCLEFNFSTFIQKKIDRVSRYFITTVYKVLKEHSTRVLITRVGSHLMELNDAGTYKTCFTLIMIDVITLCSVIQC